MTLKASAEPPITDDALEGPPGTALYDFENPKLRKFPRHDSPIVWLDYLGQGEEGMVFKAIIGDGEPVAVKVFWHTKRPPPQERYNGLMRQPEWPFEEECRTVALLEKIKWAMDYNKTDEEQAIRLDRKPITRRDAFELLRAFSDERRCRPATRGVPPPPFPLITTCHGWMVIKRDNIPPAAAQKELDEGVDWHWAIVYDFVPEEQQDISVGTAHLRFFYAAGFALEAFKYDNWRGGRLVDFGDVCSPFTRGWTPPHAPPECETWFSTSSPRPAMLKMNLSDWKSNGSGRGVVQAATNPLARSLHRP